MAIFAKKAAGKRQEGKPPPETVTIEIPAQVRLPGLVPPPATPALEAAPAPLQIVAPQPALRTISDAGAPPDPRPDHTKADVLTDRLRTAPEPTTPPQTASELRPEGPASAAPDPATEPPTRQEPAAASFEVSVAGIEEDVAMAESIDLDPEVIEPDVELSATPPVPPPFRLADAIRLMRSLPTDANPDLVVRVVRLTLGAVDVSVQDIMQDAFRREQALRESLATLRGEAAELHKQLVAKQREIATTEGELEETAAVYERLRHAEPHASHRPPPPPEAALSLSTHHKTTQWVSE